MLGSEEGKEGVGDGFGGDGGGRGGRQHAPHRPPEHGGQGRRGLQVTSNLCYCETHVVNEGVAK